MSDVYISREKAIDAIEMEFAEESGAGIIAREAIYSVELADVAPVVHSKWVGALGYWHCPECGAEPLEISPYCPGCGAKMDEEVK